MPLVWDLRARYPDAQIDWMVEENYQYLLEPLKSNATFRGIDRILPVALRRWRKGWWSAETRQEWHAFKSTLRQTSYDVVIETQGLIKSAWLARRAKRKPGADIIGLGNATEDSGYEPLARCFYTKSIKVPLRCHAVERSRLLGAAAMGGEGAKLLSPQFYPSAFIQAMSSQVSNINAIYAEPYVLFFHSTAREAKRWAEPHWIALGQYLAQQGKRIILPWGNAHEKAISERLANQIPNAIVPPAFNLQQAFSVVAGAELTVGVDTGLTHLSAIMMRPTIELYCDSPRWKTEAYWSDNIKNLGDTGRPPAVSEVLHATQDILNVLRIG